MTNILLCGLVMDQWSIITNNQLGWEIKLMIDYKIKFIIKMEIW